jgi:hypothetical protein
VSGILLLDRGTDALLARLALADAAERSLDIQYYIWHGDTTGKVLLERVLRAADRGARVRLLLDDIGTAADDRNLLAIDSHPNIEVRLFNPIASRSARLLGMMADFSRTAGACKRRSQPTASHDRRGATSGIAARPDISCRSRSACYRPGRRGSLAPIRSLLEQPGCVSNHGSFPVHPH